MQVWMTRGWTGLLLACLCLGRAGLACAEEAAPAKLEVDAAKKTVSIPCKIAQRKLPNLPEVYPIEVIATYPAPKGQKAHETVVTFDIKPSEIAQAIASLGLKPGKPAKGDAVPTGPELKVSLELPGPDGKPKATPIEKLIVDRKTGKPMPTLK